MKKAFVLFELMNHMVMIAKEARARGYEIVALNHDPLRRSGPFAVPDGLIDHLVPIESWSDSGKIQAIVDDLHRRFQIAGTYSVFDSTLHYEAALRERAGLPNNGEANLRTVLDKGAVRKKLYAEGLTGLRSMSLDEALRLDRWPFDGPAVLKPAHGTGSALCYIVASLGELRAAAAEAREAAVVSSIIKDYIVSHGDFVLEEKAEGELLSVESLVHRGEVRFVGLMGRYVLAKDPVVELGTLFPYNHPRLPEIVAASEAYHRSMSIFHGATHLEVMVPKEGRVELVDFNVRFAGAASLITLGDAFGVRYETLLTDLACGAPPDLSLVARSSRFACEMLLLPPPGATELRELVFPPESTNRRITKDLGQRLTGRADQLDIVGMFNVTGPTASEAHRTALDARARTLFNGRPLGVNANNDLAFSEFMGADLEPITLGRRRSSDA